MDKEFLNICYKFFNRFITVKELIFKLNSINVEEVRNLVDEIKRIDIEVPNSLDGYVVKKKAKDKVSIDKLDKLPRGDKDLTVLYNAIDNIKKNYEKKRIHMRDGLKYLNV